MIGKVSQSQVVDIGFFFLSTRDPGTRFDGDEIRDRTQRSIDPPVKDPTPPVLQFTRAPRDVDLSSVCTNGGSRIEPFWLKIEFPRPRHSGRTLLRSSSR